MQKEGSYIELALENDNNACLTSMIYQQRVISDPNPKGMHTTIIYELRLAIKDYERLLNDTIDVITIYYIPSSAYVDLYELEVSLLRTWYFIIFHISRFSLTVTT